MDAQNAVARANKDELAAQAEMDCWFQSQRLSASALRMTWNVDVIELLNRTEQDLHVGGF